MNRLIKKKNQIIYLQFKNLTIHKNNMKTLIIMKIFLKINVLQIKRIYNNLKKMILNSNMINNSFIFQNKIFQIKMTMIILNLTLLKLIKCIKMMVTHYLKNVYYITNIQS